MTTPSAPEVERPDIVLMLFDHLPDALEADARVQLDVPGFRTVVVRRPAGPFAGIELYLPTAVALFVAYGVLNGYLQKIGEDGYEALVRAAKVLWRRCRHINAALIGSRGKVSQVQRFSLTYSITGEITPGLRFKFLIQSEISEDEADAGITAFLALIGDLHNDRLSPANLEALLTYRPVGGTVLVSYDATKRMIVPVNAFENRE